MFKKLLGSLGVGGVRIDAVLNELEVPVGGQITGDVNVFGGSADWDGKTLLIELLTECLIEGQDGKLSRGTIVSASGLLKLGRIPARSEKAYPFVVDVPVDTPLSIGSTRSFIRTKLDVSFGADPTDKDPIKILPNAVMAAVLNGVMECGFRLVEAETEHHPRRKNPIVQEFDFRPTTSHDRRVDEVEVSFAPKGKSIEVTLTVDNKSGLFRSGGERKTKFTLNEKKIESGSLVGDLRSLISQLSR